MIGLVEFAQKSLGVTLWPGQVEILQAWAASGKRKAVLALGRRSGKGVMAACAAIYAATMIDYSASLRPGEAWFVLNVANRIEQARELLRVVREILANAPDRNLRLLIDVDRSTQDQIVFTTGATIRAMPCSSKSTPGLAVALAIFDEIARMSTAESGFQAGAEVYTALSPSTIQFGDQGYILLTSSPMGPSGIFYKLFEQGRTEAVPDIFPAQRPTWEMNPAVSRESLESDFLADPDGSRQNFGAEFLEGSGAYLTAETVALCVVKGRKSLPPLPETRYFACADPAFAAGGDRFGFGIGHLVGTGDEAVVVIDTLASWRGRRSPLNSDEVLDELAETVKLYGNPEVISDQYGGELIRAALSRRGVAVRIQTLTNSLKSDIFAAARRAINREAVELLDHPLSIEELCSLEVTPTSTGKPRIQAARGHHDDLAMVIATLCHAMRAKRGHADFDGATLGAINNGLMVSPGGRPEPFSGGRPALAASGGPDAGGGGMDEYRASMAYGDGDNDEAAERAMSRMRENLKLR